MSEGPVSELFFRKAGAEDIEDIVALINSAYRGESSKAGWTTEAGFLGGQRTDAEEVARLIAASDSMMLLCRDGTELIGCVHLERAGRRAYLGMLTVKPTLQGRGIGKRFMEVAERTAREEWSAEKMVMAVITLRTELIAFYERRGYRRTGELKEFPKDPRYGIPKTDRLQFELMEKGLA